MSTSFEIWASSFGLVAASEMGDKTQLLAFSLAARFRRPMPVLAGIFVATVLNHGLASTVGEWISAQISAQTMRLVLGGIFLAFSLWTLKPDTLDEDETKSSRFGPFLTTLTLFFLAEMGDKTQLATVALAARHGSVVLVTFGTTLGMMASDGLAVFVGERLSEQLNMKYVRWFAAGLFAVFGLVILISKEPLLAQ